jgi:hypothetical protein
VFLWSIWLFDGIIKKPAFVDDVGGLVVFSIAYTFCEGILSIIMAVSI